MKKSSLILAVVMIVLTACNGTKKFDQTFSLAFDKAKEVSGLSAYVCDKTSRTWRKAIYDNVDSRGNYCSDFNTALSRLNADLTEAGILDKIKNAKQELNDYAKALAECPKERKDAYNDFIDYVTDVNALADLAINPEGSLNSYNSNTNDIAGRINKAEKTIELKYGAFLVEVEKSDEATSDDDWD